MKLADLREGQQATICGIDTSEPQTVRLMELGLVEGVIIRHHGTAIGGDPIEIRFLGSALSLRLEQARAFEVEIAD